MKVWSGIILSTIAVVVSISCGGGVTSSRTKPLLQLFQIKIAQRVEITQNRQDEEDRTQEAEWIRDRLVIFF